MGRGFLVPLHPQAQRAQAAQGHVHVVRSAAVAGTAGRAASPARKAAWLHTASPSIRSLWPLIYLVAAWMLTSTPCASGLNPIGEAQVLSIRVTMPLGPQPPR